MSVARQLNVDATVTLDIGDQPVLIRGDGSRVVIEIPSLMLAFQMLRQIGTFGSAKRYATRISNLLQAVGLTLIIQTPQRKLLMVGREGSSWWLRLLRLSGS